MKPIQILPILLLCSALFFFSCEEANEPFAKQELSLTELLVVVEEMPEFQEYNVASYKALEGILKKRKDISKKEFNWVANIHAKFPTLDKLKNEASEEVLLRYHDLTTIDVKNGDEEMGRQFDTFLTILQEKYIYQIDDLTEVLFTLNSQDPPEKTWGECMTWCFQYAKNEKNSFFNSCMNKQGGLPSWESSCRQEAAFAFRYLLRGCASACPQDE